MDIVPIDLGAAASAARDRLATLARSTAVDGATAGGGAGGGMAAAAREAVFADALLAALHARFEELKGVAR